MVKLTVKDSLLADSLNRRSSWQTSWAGAPLVDHWSFEHMPGPKDVVVFTNCDHVEVRLNDRKVQNLERQQFKDGVIKLKVPFEQGELVAHAFYTDENGEQQKVSDTLTSAHNPYTLYLQADRDQVNSNGQEVVHITTSVVDSSGVINPHSDHMVNYEVEGPGKIRVIDNGDLADHTPYGSTSRKVKYGKQLLILQAGTEPGDLIVNATADGLRSSKVKIKSKD
jgi:beta-galactosidase